MNDSEQALLRALTDLETAAAVSNTAQVKPDILSLIQRIDALADTLPAGAAPELRHYLQRKSYTKARSFLEANCASNP